ncbi:MAG: hypothetical protein KatS3mg049_1332 [Caldilinea sp.]|nr:MAG: hypothetical protein KatS3mg049_1332 [Caldilinea sp.]
MLVAMNQYGPLDLRDGGNQGVYQGQSTRCAAAQYKSGLRRGRIYRYDFLKEKLVGSQGGFDFLLRRP